MLRNNGRHNFRSPFDIQPSLVLDFAGTGTLDPSITFTRSTTGTYYNSSGVLATAAINVPRFSYNPSTLTPLGLLREPQSTNLILYSENFTNTYAAWNSGVSSVRTLNTITAPDGTFTGNTLTSVNANNGSFARQYIFYSAGSNTGFIFVKKGNWPYFGIRLGSSITGGKIPFVNLDTLEVNNNGVSGASISITPINNGWYKISLTFTTTAGSQVSDFGMTDSSGIQATNLGAGQYCYIWGCQIEPLSFGTSYIPTTSAQVTRATDNASMTGTNFSNWYNQGKGTIYCESWIFSPVTAYPSPYSLNDAANTNRIQPYINNSLTSLGGDITTGGVAQANILITVPSMTSFIKSALSYELNNVNFAADGILGTTDTVATIPTNLTQLSIGTNSANGLFAMYIKKITYYPIALSPTKTQALTT